jgi:predicted alpha/beta hydrolase family esterase
VRVIIVHGTGGSPAGNWFPWLSSELLRRGIETIVPKFPTPEGQNLKAWLRVLDGSVGALRPDDIVIGHSIGAAFVCRALEASTQRIKVAVLVAGFPRQLGNPQFDPYNESFLTTPLNWPKLHRAAEQFVLFSGDDDPYVPLEFGKEFAEGLNTTLNVIPGGGHLNSEKGMTEFPELLNQLKKWL